MNDSQLPPSPRLLALGDLGKLPGTPPLEHVPADTIGEIVVLGLSGDDERTIAHVAVYVETATEAIYFNTTMPFEGFLECIPSWTLLNTPTNLLGTGSVGIQQARVERRARARQRGSNSESDLGTAWRTGRRPAKTTDRYLLSAIELVPNGWAVDYVEAVRRVRLRRFDRQSRALIADVVDVIASLVDRMPKAD